MADNLTLLQIREGVRRKMSDDSFDATTIDEAANDFQNQLFTDHRIRTMEAHENLSIAAGANDVSFPDDFMTVLTINVFDSNNEHFADITQNHIPYTQFMGKYPNFEFLTRTKPYNWTDFANGLRFAAPADAAYSIGLDYLREPELMVADSDEAEVTTTYREMFILGTLARTMEVNEDYDIAGVEREKLDGLITAFVRNMGRGQVKIGPTVMNSRKRSSRTDW